MWGRYNLTRWIGNKCTIHLLQYGKDISVKDTSTKSHPETSSKDSIVFPLKVFVPAKSMPPWHGSAPHILKNHNMNWNPEFYYFKHALHHIVVDTKTLHSTLKIISFLLPKNLWLRQSGNLLFHHLPKTTTINQTYLTIFTIFHQDKSTTQLNHHPHHPLRN